MQLVRRADFFGSPDRGATINPRLSMTLVRHDARLVIPQHRHLMARICVVLKGSLAENHGRGFDEFFAGWVLFWPPGVVHEDKFGPSHNQTMQIELSEELFGLVHRVFPAAEPPHALRAEAFEGAVTHILREFRRRDDASSVATEGAVYELVARASRLIGSAEPPRSLAVQRAIEFLRGHLDVPTDSEAICAASGLSRNRLAARFRAEVGVPIAEFMRRERVNRAAELLATTDEAISVIAVLCGYCDQAHLTREFRSLLATTPAAWRKLQAARS